MVIEQRASAAGLGALRKAIGAQKAVDRFAADADMSGFLLSSWKMLYPRMAVSGSRLGFHSRIEISPDNHWGSCFRGTLTI